MDFLALIIGTTLGSTVAGIVGYTINHIFDAKPGEKKAIIFGYVWILTLGLYSEYGQLLTILLCTSIGVGIFGKQLFLKLLKPKLPDRNPKTIEEIDEDTNSEDEITDK